MTEEGWLDRWLRYVICRDDKEAVNALMERRSEQQKLEEQLERWYREGLGQPGAPDWSEDGDEGDFDLGNLEEGEDGPLD